MAESTIKGPKNNIVFFGDSWTMGTGIDMEDRPTKRFTAIIAKKLGLTENNYGVGGAGFVRKGNLFSTQITTASSSMTSEQKNNTKYVVIVGGVNDYRHKTDDGTNTTAFVNGVINTATLAHNTFPHALIVIGIGDTNKTYFPKFAKDWYKTAVITCEQSLQFPSMAIKNLYNVISGENANYYSDNLHPSEQGHARFGGYIANAILGGGQSVSRYLGNVSLVSPASVAEGGSMCIYRINDEIVIDQVGLKYSSAIKANTQIGSINAAFAPPANSYYPYYQGNLIVGCICITGSGSLRLIPNSGESITAGYSQQIRYMFGKETNTDEN